MAHIIVLVFLTLVTGLRESSALSLTSSVSRISQQGTPNFTMTCSRPDQSPMDNEENQLSEIHRMKIMKFEDNMWSPVIEMDSDWKEPKVLEGLVGSGYISASGNESSFLKVEWSLAMNSTGGEYACDVIGYSRNGRGISQRSSPVYIYVEVPLTLYDLFKMIEATRSGQTANNKETDTAIGLLRKEAAKREEKVVQLNMTLEALTESYYEHWPQGTYGLLQPESGCPLNLGVTWKTGYRKIHTESTERNKDSVSETAHMAKPIMERSDKNNFMNMRWCVVTEPSLERPWPKGHYCINQKGSCPNGFSEGYLKFHGETTNPRSDIGGEQVRLYYSSYITEVHYCCRDDGSPSVPIHLPRSKSFYLYRYGGTCQQVVGMNLTQEFMFFDTGNSDNRCVYDDCPDWREAFPDVKLELCHYQSV